MTRQGPRTPIAIAAISAVAIAAAQDAAGLVASLLRQFVDHAYDPHFNTQHRPLLLLFAYFALATGSLLIPVPEELLLGVIGFSAWLGATDLPQRCVFLLVAVLPCCAAVVCGDVIIWFLGRRLGLAARKRFQFLARCATDERVARVEQALNRHGAPVVMIARLIPGARICTFFVAGASRMPLWRFLAFDFLGSLASVPIFLVFGALAAHEDYGATWAREAAGSAATVVGICALGAALAVWLVLAVFRRSQNTSQVARDAVPLLAEPGADPQ